MNSESFSIDEFISGGEEKAPEEVDVQKAVVEELAAEKVELESKASALAAELAAVRDALSRAEAEKEALREGEARARGEAESLKAALSASAAEAERLKQEIHLKEEALLECDTQARNPNALALLDRDVDLPDRFPGETRDHVLEVVKEARDKAEEDGRIRRAQVLEGVLVANEPNGSLAEARNSLKRLFAENMNVVNGVMMEKLKDLNISYKDADEFLSAEEILKRNY
jgi:chromosome segregation ATPase